MELQYHGADCLRLTTKKSVIITDPKSDITNIKPDLKKATIVLATQTAFEPEAGSAFLINGPGEYEFEDVSVAAIYAQPHIGASGDKSATIYRITASDITVLVVGHIDAKLTEEQLEKIGMIDILVVPVGGNGYTLDAVGAATVVRSIEPKMIIPVHCSDDGLKYDVPQSERDLFVKELGAPVAEDAPDKLKLKALPEQTTIQFIKIS